MARLVKTFIQRSCRGVSFVIIAILSIPLLWCLLEKDVLTPKTENKMSSNNSLIPSFVTSQCFKVSYHSFKVYLIQATLAKQLDSLSLGDIINKARDYQIIIGCLRILDSVYTDCEDPTLGLTPDTVLFCLSHQNKDIRDSAASLFKNYSELREP